MADYWVSQIRKYCEFCKCWITDNKPSVEFHEKGRRHQANVKRKLNNIHKQSAQTQKASERFDATLRHMESAALEAYRKDVKNNADLTSIAINQKLETGNLQISSTSGVKKLWNEAIDNNGKTYYYNVMTYERVVQPPKEGFLSIKEQQEQAIVEDKKKMQVLEKWQKTEGALKLQQKAQEEMEERARIAREKLKERRVAADETVTTPQYLPLIEPGKTEPYGRWETVKEVEYADLQLPKQEEYFEPPVEYEPEPIEKTFKEKTVETLKTEGGESAFKKRKIRNDHKRNTRQRLDDD